MDISQLNKQVSDYILPQFASVVDAISLLGPVTDLRNLIDKTSNINWGKLNDKITLSKRLTQSLLIVSTSDQLHKEILTFLKDLILNIIKHNEYLGSDLGLYIPGVFSFFSLASINRKLDIIQTFIPQSYLKLNKLEIYYSLPGFIKGIIPGIEEINQTLSKTTLDLFKSVISIVGIKDFFSILYTVIIKTPHVRLACLKLMHSEIPSITKYRNLNEGGENSRNEEELNSQYLNEYFPDLSTLTINAFITMIEDDNSNVKKSAIDLLIKRLPFNSSFLNSDDRVLIITSMINLLKKPESNITRRILNWMLGVLYQEDDLKMTDEGVYNVINTLKLSIKYILTKSIKTGEDLINYIRIFENFFSLKGIFIEGLFTEFSLSIIEISDNLNRENFNQELLLKVRKFFVGDEVYSIMLWNSMKERIVKVMLEIEENFLRDSDYNNEYNINNSVITVLNTIDLLAFTKSLIPMPSLELNYIIINRLISIAYLFFDKKLVSFNEINEILTIINEFVMEYKNLKFKYSDSYNNNLDGTNNKISHNFVETTNLFSDFYDKYLNYIYVNQDNYQTDEKMLFKRSTELMILLENITIYESRNILLPEWTMNLFRLAFSVNNTISLDTLKYISDIYMILKPTEKLTLIREYYTITETEITTNIRNNSGLNIDELKSNEYVSLSTKNIVEINPKKNLCINLIIEKLWNLLDEYTEQSKVILLLNNFFNIFPEIFFLIIKQSFQIDDIEENETGKKKKSINQSHLNDESFYYNMIDKLKNTINNSNKSDNTRLSFKSINKLVEGIKRFKQFWKLSMDFYPQIQYFKDSPDIIFNVFDFLDNEHPVLRHYSKSWVVNTTSQLNKLLDPLIIKLNSYSNRFNKVQRKEDVRENFNKSEIYDLHVNEEYDVFSIIKYFDMIKKIILNIKTPAISYLLTTKVKKEVILSDTLHQQDSDIKYLEYIIHISLRYIKVQFDEKDSLASKPKDKNDLSNSLNEHFLLRSSTCEFLEFLISFVEDKSRIIKISEYLTYEILIVLNRYIKISDEVVQIQLLNILTVIYQIKIENWKKYSDISVKVFSMDILHSCIIQGLQTNYNYLRSHYVEFAEMLLPFFKNLIDKKENNEIANKLLLTNSDFIAKFVYSDKKLEEKQNNNTINTNTSDINLLNRDKLSTSFKYNKENKYNSENLINRKISKIEQNDFDPEKLNKEDIEKILDNLFISNYQQKNNGIQVKGEDIHFMIKGMKRILFNYLDINKSEISSLDWKKFFSKVNSEKFESFENVYEILYLVKKDETINVSKDIKNSLSIHVVSDILVSLIFSWNNEGQKLCTTKDFHMSNLGVLPYDIKESNKIIDIEKESFVEKRNVITTILLKDSLKAEIISIFQNLFISNPFCFFEIFIKLWIKNNHRYYNSNISTESIKEIYSSKSEIKDQVLLSLIEILIIMEIPMNIILFLFRKNLKITQKKSNIKMNGNYPYIVTIEDCSYLNKICTFLYTYLSYSASVNFIDVSAYDEVINIMEILKESKFPMIQIWSLELINLLSSTLNTSFKEHKALLKFTNQQVNQKSIDDLDKLKLKINKELSYLFKDISEKVLNMIFDPKYDTRFIIDRPSTNFLGPFSPTIYEQINSFLTLELINKEELFKKNIILSTNILGDNKSEINQVGRKMKIQRLLTKQKDILIDFELSSDSNTRNIIDHGKDFYWKLIYNYINNITLDNEDYILFMKKIAFSTINSIYFNTLRNLFFDNLNKINLYPVLDKIFAVLKDLDVDSFIFEFSNHFLLNLMKDANQIVIFSHKKHLMDFYLSDKFFKMSEKCLKFWKIILQKFANVDLIDEFLYK